MVCRAWGSWRALQQQPLAPATSLYYQVRGRGFHAARVRPCRLAGAGGPSWRCRSRCRAGLRAAWSALQLRLASTQQSVGLKFYKPITPGARGAGQEGGRRAAGGGRQALSGAAVCACTRPIFWRPGRAALRCRGCGRRRPARTARAGFRGRVVTTRKELWKGGPFKPLTQGFARSGGRNHHGRVVSRHIGGGSKRIYRLVDFQRPLGTSPALVERLEYDPNRSAHIALVRHQAPATAPDGRPLPLASQYSYFLAPQGVAAGDLLQSGTDVPIRPGNTLPLSHIPIGMQVGGAGGQRQRQHAGSGPARKQCACVVRLGRKWGG